MTKAELIKALKDLPYKQSLGESNSHDPYSWAINTMVV